MSTRSAAAPTALLPLSRWSPAPGTHMLASFLCPLLNTRNPSLLKPVVAPQVQMLRRATILYDSLNKATETRDLTRHVLK